MGDLYVGVDCGSFHLKPWHRAVRERFLFLAAACTGALRLPQVVGEEAD